MTRSAEQLPIVIIGGSFAGITLAQNLEKRLDSTTEIIVISRDNYLVFTPMLPEVAARTVSPLHVVVAGRQTTKRTRWIAATATQIDAQSHIVTLKLGDGGTQSLAYADLVLACGMNVNFSEVPGMAAHALPLKTVDDAFTLGNALIERFELAALEKDPAMQAKLLTSVVIGVGFSGVEVAGHLHDLSRNIQRYYKFAPGVKPRMILLQRGERILPELQHESLSDFTLQKLRQNGVEVRLKTGVHEISRAEVHLNGGERVPYGLLIGTTGNTATPFLRECGLPMERNRLKTNPEMQVLDNPRVWAIGDCAIVTNAFNHKPSPPTAQFALRQAKQLAMNLVRSRQGRELVPFYFRPQGLLASIGQKNGVAEVYGMKFSGLIAWFLWRAVYFLKMPSLPRKIGVAVDWLMDALFGENLVRVGESGNPRFRKEHYVAGDVVYRQGQPSRTLYLLEKGIASVMVAGNPDPVTKLEQGDHFGLSAIERHETLHTTTVLAKSSLDLVAIDRPDLEEMSRDVLTRELARLLELRQLRQSWQKVIERFPEVSHLRVADAMKKEPAVLGKMETLQTALRKLTTTIALPVVDGDGKLIGCCTRNDVNAAMAGGFDPLSLASGFMSKPPLTLSPDSLLRQATVDYLRIGMDLVPVVDADMHLLGMFGLVEAAQTLLDQGVVK